MLALFDSIFLQPLTAIYATLFSAVPGIFGVAGQIVGFAIVINALLAPVYWQMELRSATAHALRQRVVQDVQRMRKYFKGRELYFYTRAVHRQHGYRPISQVLGSSELLLQIVVFFTVFRFLSSSESLVGASFGPLTDLSRPDQLVAGVNVLPLLMTLVNVASVAAYSADSARRWQGAALAVVFLVLLYNSPAGLVLYWITNNVFSLARSLVRNAIAARPPGQFRKQLCALRTQM